MQQVSKKYLSAFINADDEFNFVKENEIINARNIRFSTTDEGTTSKWESILSNQEIVNSYLPVGNNTSIGKASTEDGRYIIAFNYNPNGNHGIYAYRKTDNTFYKVLLDSQVTGGLNFSPFFLIDAIITEGLVYFTDNLNEPRKVNIEAGIKLNHPSFTTTQSAYTSPLNQEVITIIRRAPSLPLSVTKTNSALIGLSLNNNQIENFSGRFFWRYTYRDNEQSVFSAHSELIPYNETADTFDVVTVTAPFSEKVDQDVKSVVFGVIYADGEQGFEIKTWDKSNSTDLSEINNHNLGITPLTFQFTNSEVGSAIDSTSQSKYFDAVPNKSKTIGKAGSRIFLANNLSGYDTPLTTSLTADVAMSSTSITALKTGSSRRIGVVFFDKYQRQCGVVPYSKLVTVANRSFDWASSYPYAINWTLDNTNAINEIPSWAYYYAIVATKDITRNYFLQAYAGEIFYAEKDADGNYKFDKTEYSTSNVGVAVKLNVLNGQGMGYAFSEGDLITVHVKNSGITTTATLSVKDVASGYVVCSNYNFGTLNYNSIALFEVFSPNNKTASNFFYEQGSVYKVTNPTSGARAYSTTNGLIGGDVYLLQKDVLNQITYSFPAASTTSDEHTLACNFVSQLFPSTKYTTGNSPLLSTSGFNSTTDNSRWIIKTNSSSVKFNFKGTIKVSSGTGGNYKAWIEVNNGVSSTTYDIVPVQHIESNTVYTFNYNTDITVPPNSRVFIIAWETDGISGRTKIYQSSSMVVTTIDDSVKSTFECMSPNDKFYQKWFTNAGRLQIITPLGQQKLRTAIRWSNTIIEGTRTNGLSSFDPLNQKILQRELVEINKLQLANKVDEQGQGNVMLAICPTEAASLYLGEVQLMAASEAGSVATTDNVIGTVNVLKGSYGTIHPESVVEHRGDVFWFDALGGRFVQYSINGIDDISGGENDVFKFTRVSKQLSKYILAQSPVPFVYGGVDPHHKEVYWTIPNLGVAPKGYLSDFAYFNSDQPEYLDVDLYSVDNVAIEAVTYPYDILDLQGKTFVYKIHKRWMGAFDWTPEGFVTLDTTLYSLKGGKLYQHNVSGSYNNFYGNQYRSKIALVCNDENTVKEIQTIAVEGTTPEWVHIRIEEPCEQSSDLVASDFDVKEGVNYAAVLRDRLSQNVSGTVEDKLFKGDLIRGKAILLLVQWAKGTNANFRMISIGYNNSTGHY
jgi:hypothetical protein